jgi:predicted TPR repeat methyltransferase
MNHNPDNVSADPRAEALSRAIAQHQQGSLQQAEMEYLRLLEQSPDDADTLHFLGLLRFQQERSAEAEDLLRKSLGSAPHNAHAWNNLGNILFTTDRLDAAADAYLHALELDLSLAAPWKNLGECLERSGSPERAVALFRHIIETVPGFTPAYEALGRLLRIFGRQQEAVEVYRRWVELEPERPTARHLLAAVTGENVPERASDSYVRELFDGFADEFDTKLAKLEYRAPGLVCAALQGALETPGIGTGLLVLDAGCGTGLCAPLLRPLAEELVGIDLSPGMLRKAQQRGGYDRLEQAELTAYMRASPGRFDVVVCVDTLCYFGSLGAFFEAVRAALKPKGLLAFSVERLPDAAEHVGYRIEHHGRFKHAQAYVREALGDAGFTVLSMGEEVLRQEIFNDVAGLAIVAQAPPAPAGE